LNASAPDKAPFAVVNQESKPKLAAQLALDSISPLEKGLGRFDGTISAGDAAQLGWNLLREDLSLPSAVLYAEKLAHNLHWMRRFIEAYGLHLAPHGKTTMAPALFKMQLDAGAWGITLATAQQTHAAYAHGVRCVLMANQLVGRANMELIAHMLADSGFEFYCLVDSAALADQLGSFFSAKGLRLNVLLELGVMGGRAGVRDEAQMDAFLAALARWSPTIQLCGIELYEGVLDNEPAIRAFLTQAVDLTRRFMAEGRFHRTPILSGAGSAWYDVVAEVFAAAGFGKAVEIVLRPGCYLTHDVGSYRNAQARILEHNPIARQMHEGLVPALHLWACVQAIPEPEKAIVTMGKRDAAFDSGLPVPALHFRPGGAQPGVAPDHWAVTKMMDQHAFLKIEGNDDLQVGDMIAFNICHPCLTFDKWRVLPIVDENYNVVEVVRTFF
jgi:D-serine deaminase-like pyridoxal phosphate-dependent protein